MTVNDTKEVIERATELYRKYDDHTLISEVRNEVWAMCKNTARAEVVAKEAEAEERKAEVLEASRLIFLLRNYDADTLKEASKAANVAVSNITKVPKKAVDELLKDVGAL